MRKEMMLSERVKQVKPSGIRKFFDLASETEGVISLGVGERILRHHGISVKLRFILFHREKLFIPPIKVCLSCVRRSVAI